MISVFLIKNVPSLGKIGDKVLAPRGMARNFLFPKNFAVPVNDETTANFDKLKANAVVEYDRSMSEAQTLKGKIDGAIVEFHENVKEDGENLFGSVSARNIAEKLSKNLGLTITHDMILLNSPIKVIGEHTLQVSLHSEVTAEIFVHILHGEQDN